VAAPSPGARWSDSVELTVNGDAVDAAHRDRGYVAIHRAWHKGDVVELRLNLARPSTKPTRASTRRPTP